ncbi:hypothetical protein [Paenibacillus cucumis (ex Kampfer et al. 2016)]|uniref:Uncharacterized protein n=1 Tax=Paenibacillus cucumis (ex Kampfer et al. 2016) TaxID=1776858 RepID=A0ABS7KJ89_9BACL|nr:hypothetical protein [Paenibacillus cucumis (ex Kampfer et al. 2016)]MBY0204212.1 hypothetical protein [Paenibacillus cucumis (ex Kampfer et al. 2016)]
MEFEFHVTLSDLSPQEKQTFIRICEEENVKPVLIELDQGEHIHQPMITGIVHSEDFQDVQRIIEEISITFRNNGFTVVRTKVEIPAKEERFFKQPMVPQYRPYFEWHGKVQVEDVNRLKHICAGTGGHISRNSLHKNGSIRFVTVREYEHADHFYRSVEEIHNILQSNQIELIKQQYELCIYDSREELDRGWI